MLAHLVHDLSEQWIEYRLRVAVFSLSVDPIVKLGAAFGGDNGAAGSSNLVDV